MTIRRYNSTTATFEQAEYRGQAPVFRYDSMAGRWLDTYLTDGLVGYWSFEDVHMTSTQALDASGQGNDGTLSGGITTNVAGSVGEAADFDGVDDQITVSNSASLDLEAGNVTVTAWVRREGPSEGAGIVSKHFNSNNVQYELGLHPPGGTMTENPAFAFHDGGWKTAEAPAAIAQSTWVHLAGTYDGATIRVFVDGVEEASTATAAGLPADPDDIFIGRRHDTAVSDSHFDGKIDEARVYNRALSPAEIQALYAQGRPV